MGSPCHPRQSQFAGLFTAKATFFTGGDMATNMRHLDEEAAAWEADPACLRTCELAYKALMHHVPQLQPGVKSTRDSCLQVGVR